MFARAQHVCQNVGAGDIRGLHTRTIATERTEMPAAAFVIGFLLTVLELYLWNQPCISQARS